ncbi:MAG: L-2-hydroxyglutarate oxidase [Acidobacteriaceae bacterium]
MGVSANDYDFAIIGAGIVGLATALEFNRSHPSSSLVVLEKEDHIAAHQTSHNSGVIHSGIYYKPGTDKARMCVQGAMEMVQFCREHGLPHEVCGKVIVATSEKELSGLQELFRRGVANKVPGVRLVNAEELREIEPHVAGVQGIHVPGAAITDYGSVSNRMAEIVRERASLRLKARVLGLKHKNGKTVIETSAGAIRAGYVVNCAGLQSDLVSRMAGARLKLRIVPFRGEYYEIAAAKQDFVRGLIYPVPNPKYPFLGVHFTRKIQGGVAVGPNAVLAFKREGYSRTSFSLVDSLNLATFGGFWIMAAKLWREAAGEYYRSWSKKAFTEDMQKLMPELSMRDIKPGGSGVRAQALERTGQLADDFRFVDTEGMLHVCNVPSPAATASLVIGREIVRRVEKVNVQLS